MSRDYLYVNKRNDHKFLEIRRYEDGHYVCKQSIRSTSEDGVVVINYTGCNLKQNNHGGVWHRISKKAMLELLEDYELVVDNEGAAEETQKYWPSREEWERIAEEACESCDDDILWGYIGDFEDEVNKELQIFPEPSVQGRCGGVFIFDESGEDRKEDGGDYPWYEDFEEWCSFEWSAAISSRSAEEYKQKYREHVGALCSI